MINCEFLVMLILLRHKIPRSCAYLDSLGKFDFRAYVVLKKQTLG